MALSDGIAATIAVIVVVAVVALALAFYCFCWKESSSSESLSVTKTNNNVVTTNNNNNMFSPSSMMRFSSPPPSSLQQQHQYSRASSPPASGRSNFSSTSTSMNFVRDGVLGGGDDPAALKPYYNSSSTKSSRSNNHRLYQYGNEQENDEDEDSFFKINNNSGTAAIIPIGDDESSMNKKKNNNMNSRDGGHVPVNQRITDGTRLYYTFVDDYDQQALNRAISLTNAATKEVEQYLKKGKILTSKKIAKKRKNGEEVAEVFELDLNEVGLGAETNQYVSFALLCELAAKHLPDHCEWEEGEVPPLRLASVDLEEAAKKYSPDLVIGSNIISVIDSEALVESKEAVKDTAHDPLVLMIVDDNDDEGQHRGGARTSSNKPGSVPVPWKVQHQKNKNKKQNTIKNKIKKQQHSFDTEEDDDEDEDEENEEGEAVLHKSYHYAEQDISVDVSGIYSPRQVKQMKKKTKKRNNNQKSSDLSDSSSCSSSYAASSVSVRKSQKQSGEFKQTVSFDLSPSKLQRPASPSRSSSSYNNNQQQRSPSYNYSNTSINISQHRHQQPYFPTLTHQAQKVLLTNPNNTSMSRGPSLSSASERSFSQLSSARAPSSTSTGMVSSRTPLFSQQYSQEDVPNMMMPLLAPRIYPYSPVVTTRTPIRITGVQYRCKRTGVFIQDRWKIFALDEVLSKLPAEFMQLVAFMAKNKDKNQAPSSSSHSRNAINLKLKKQYSNFDDDEDDTSSDDTEEQDYTSPTTDILDALAATQRPQNTTTNNANPFLTKGSLLDTCLPKIFEFSSRKSTVTKSTSLFLPHLSVTAARDGTLFVKSTPKLPEQQQSSALKKKSSKKNKINKEVTISQHQQQQTPSESGDSSVSQYSSYNQSTIQLLHVDVVPMTFSYKVEGGLQQQQQQQSPWHVVECTDDKIYSENEANKIRFKKEGSLANISSSQFDKNRDVRERITRELPAAFKSVYLPLGRVCVMAKTRDDNKNSLSMRAGRNDPSWSTVFTVNATNKEDTRDYSEFAALHFAGI